MARLRPNSNGLGTFDHTGRSDRCSWRWRTIFQLGPERPLVAVLQPLQLRGHACEKPRVRAPQPMPHEGEQPLSYCRFIAFVHFVRQLVVECSAGREQPRINTVEWLIEVFVEQLR